MTTHQVTLKSDGDARSAQLAIDGVPVYATRAYLALDPNSDRLPVIRVELPMPIIDHDAPTRVELFSHTREILLALGWTPPVEGD